MRVGAGSKTVNDFTVSWLRKDSEVEWIGAELRRAGYQRTLDSREREGTRLCTCNAVAGSSRSRVLDASC